MTPSSEPPPLRAIAAGRAALAPDPADLPPENADLRRGNALRLTTTARGYGRAHQLLRRRLAREVATGLGVCWRCGQPIDPGEPWDLGHDDIDRRRYRGPEHARCNRATWRRRRLKVSRSW
jgi:hypothetical protein